MEQKNKNLASAVEVSKRLNISYQLVNYYTNIGLFSVCALKGNKRFYDADEMDKVFRKIKDLRRQGYPLRVIRNELLKG
jgi:DNA-binding transcriptional MerR regulator